MSVLIAVGLLALAVTSWRVARSRRISRLQLLATTPRPDAVADMRAGYSTTLPRRGESDLGRAAAEGAAITSLAIPVQAMWEFSQIDPLVVEAVSSASSHASGLPDIDADYSGFLGYVQDNLARLDESGFVSRLQGYVGEQRVFEILQDQGHVVDVAPLSNTANWDAFVDGHAVNVKSYADISGVEHAAGAHPDVTFLVNADVSGVAHADNITLVDGFSHADTVGSLHSSLDAGADLVSGGFASDAAFGGIPIMLVAMSVFRETRAVQRGQKTTEAAVVDVALTIGIQGSGMMAGAVLGGKAGAAAGLGVDAALAGHSLGSAAAIGGTIGAIGGGIAGSVAGRKVVREIRGGPLRSAEGELQDALRTFGARCIDDEALVRLREYAALPAERASAAHLALQKEAERARGSLRWQLWPASRQVLTVETAAFADYAYQDTQVQASDIDSTLGRIGSCADPAVAVGLMLANEPDLRQLLDCEYPELDAVRLAYSKVQRVRLQQEKPLTRSETFKAASKFLRTWLE